MYLYSIDRISYSLLIVVIHSRMHGGLSFFFLGSFCPLYVVCKDASHIFGNSLRKPDPQSSVNPQLPVVAFSCLEAGGLQECGINITREVFQAWLKDPEFVPQLPGGWVAEWLGGKFHSNDGSLFWYVEFGSGQSPGRSRS